MEPSVKKFITEFIEDIKVIVEENKETIEYKVFDDFHELILNHIDKKLYYLDYELKVQIILELEKKYNPIINHKYEWRINSFLDSLVKDLFYSFMSEYIKENLDYFIGKYK